MTHATDSNPTDSKQAKLFASDKKCPRRRLEHLADLQEGVDKFDMVPRCLSRAYFDGKFPEAKYKLLRVMMSHGEYFRVKRKYLEGIFAKKSLAKYLPQLISEGYIEVESVQLKRGAPENVYHVCSICDWLIYRQNEYGSLGNRFRGDDDKDTNPSSSCSLPAPEIPIETKEEKPCHNDDADLIQASISPKSTPKNESASSLGKRVPSPVKYAMQYAKSMEFLYSKSRNGGYDWELANEEAEKFIREHGKESAQVLKNWALSYVNFHDRVKIQPSMFEHLWTDFQLMQRMGDG